MKTSDVITAIREEFPKHSKAAFSLATRTNETGVQLCHRANAIYQSLNGTKPRRNEVRTKAVRFSCRLAESDAEAVRTAMGRNGIPTQQELLESLLIWFVRTTDEKRASVRAGTRTEANAKEIGE